MTKLFILAVAAALTSGATSMPDPVPTVPPARDGNIAIEEEYCAARRKNTLAAYDLFIARHPDHPLAAQAKKERAQIAGAGRRD